MRSLLEPPGRSAADSAARARPPRSDLPSQILRVGAWIAVVGFLAQGAADVIGFIWFDRTVGQLNADSELTIWSWASSTATACAALATALWAVASERHRSVYTFLTFSLAFFSADDMLQIHERLQVDVGEVEQSARIIWPTVYLPLLVFSFVLLWWWAALAYGPATRAIRLGLLMLVAAVGCELVSFGMVQIGLDEGTFAYELEVILEEGLELVGWILVSSGLLAGFVDRATHLSHVPA